MLKFNFENNNYSSTDGTVKATARETKILSEYDGKKGVLSFNGNGYLSLTESKLSYSDKCYRIRITFCIEKTATSDMVLLYGTTIPLEVSLKRIAQNNTYYVYSQVIVDSEIRSVRSKEVLSRGKWYTLDFILLDGNFVILIDDKPFCRRVFSKTPEQIGATNRALFYIGGTTNSAPSFKGYIDEIVFSTSVTTKQNEIATELADIGYMEADSKQQDLLYENINTGNLISEGNKMFSDDTETSYYYNIYSNGVIFWSYAYKSVYMTKVMFEEYSKRIKDGKYLGFPYDDEVIISASDSYCKFEVGALFKVKGVNGLVYLPPDMFAEYERNRLEYKFPISSLDLKSYSYKDEKEDFAYEMEYIKFPEYTMFRFITSYNDVYTIFKLPNVLAEKYIKKFSEYGPLEQYYVGYTHKYRNNMGTQRTERYYYWRCMRKTACLKYIDNNTVPSIIKMNNDVFDFFVENNGVNLSEGCGDYKFPVSDPKTSKQGTPYQNFQGGVIFKKNDKLYGYTQLKLVFVKISSGHIDDGINDRNAELYIEVFLGLNEKYNIVDKKRWPDYSERKHGGTGFNITFKNSKENVYYNFPKNITGNNRGLQGEDIIYFHVKAHDWDKYTGNDYLGSYTFEFNIDTGWGILEDAISSEKGGYDRAITEKKATYSDVYLTHQGTDNRGGVANIKLTFRMEDKSEPVNIDDYFRKYAYWSIDNFKSTGKVSRARYDSLFGVQTGKWYDWLLAFWDSVWYKVVNDDDNGYWGKNGLCFGMSVAALESIYGYGSFPVPLCDWNPDLNGNLRDYSHSTSDEIKPEYYTLFQDKHMYQAGWDHIMHSIDKAVKGEMFIPTSSFDAIKKELDKGYCLVNLFDDDGGHTVLAYKYDKNKIYIADSNHPWYQNDKNSYESRPDETELKKINRDSSYLKLSNDTIKKIEVHYADSNNKDVLSKTYKYCYVTPFKLVSHKPHVPSWGEVIFDSLSTLVRSFEFCVNNFYEFMFMITMGDAVPTNLTGQVTNLKIVDIPYQGAQEPRAYTKKGIHIMCGIVKNNAEITLRGNGKGNYKQLIFGKNKFISISSTITETENDTISLSNLMSSKPTITVESSNSKKGISIDKGNAVIRYGSNATPKLAITSNTSIKPSKIKFYLNRRAQQNGDHEMHCEYCNSLPMSKNRIYLGEFANDSEAIKAAKKIYTKADGCSKCCPANDKNGKE